MDDWSGYLTDFHTRRPGIADAVLSRCTSGNHTPYRWLARGVSQTATRVLDVRCGAGAMGRELAAEGRTVIGLDRNAAELAAAHGPGPFVRCDALAMPFADGSFDAVVSTLGLAQIHPTSGLLDEVSRVLRPGGVFVGLVPTIRPLNARDMRTAARLTQVLLGTPRFPATVELAVGKLLEQHGLRKAEDARERYHFTVEDREDADLLLSGLYLPTTSPQRLEAASDWLTQQAAEHDGIRVPIPLRRVVAIK